MKYLIVFLALAGGHFVHSGYIYDSGLGTDCLYDEDCATRNSFCKGNKICACKIGFQYDPGSDICFPKELNLKCNEDYDCSALQNSRCTNEKCQCKPDYVPSKDRSSCLPSMKLTHTCEEDVQCNTVMNQSYCDPITRQCRCARGYYRDHYRMLCTEQKKLHDRCLTTQECESRDDLIGKVECKSTESIFIKTCECAEGYKEQYDTCAKDGSSTLIFSLPIMIGLVLTTKLL